MKIRAQGSILIEVILSVVLMSICLTTLISGMLSGYRTTLLNRDYSLATALLENQLARARYMNFQSATDASWTQHSKVFSYQSQVRPLTELNRPDLGFFQSQLQWPSGSKTMRITTATFYMEPKEGSP